jgi:hypothetical protein
MLAVSPVVIVVDPSGSRSQMHLEYLRPSRCDWYELPYDLRSVTGKNMGCKLKVVLVGWVDLLSRPVTGAVVRGIGNVRSSTAKTRAPFETTAGLRTAQFQK